MDVYLQKQVSVVRYYLAITAFHNTSDTGTCTMEHGGAIPKTSKSVPTTTCNDDGYSASVNRRTAAKESMPGIKPH